MGAASLNHSNDDIAVNNISDVEAVQPCPAAADEFLVTWDEPADKDPANPMNWSNARKWSMVSTLSFLSFLVPLASSMMAPAVPQILEEFKVTNDMLGTFVVSVFVLGFAAGPLVIAPASELHGRLIVYHVCNSLFVVFTIGCALSTNMGMLMAFRFWAGFSGVCVLTCGSGSIADMMPAEIRGKAMGIWSVGPLIGPVVGPVCAGFLVADKSWRWVFWVTAIAAGVATLFSFAVLRETYAPVLLERKAAQLRKQTGDTRYRSSLQTPGSQKQVFMTAILRPARLLLTAAVVRAVCLYIAIIYGLMYVLFTTYTFVFEEQYGFSSEGAGLSFIAGGVGNLIGMFYVSVFSDKIIKNRKAMNLPVRPEDRLHPALTVPSTLLLPTGLIIYGWTADKHVHWIVPMIGNGIMGCGMMGVFMCCQTYLVDAFTQHAASATAANAVLRSTLGAVLPLCGLQLYDALGLGWGNTLLGGVALLMAPVPILLGIFGERMRNGSALRKKS
ncbi:MFS general substrate transporter [Cryphonectria parasitica EP155]|uniref:MFS general substrate transporter n=1 Tax=Cryphonectria parasitica (strain ATCC 38755 / EP155) TaxID=660469 RepID=A0A9P4XUG1_CRYP1|nr:MFS general substrate transporter [Cryphonectria parasitica EP155]KAF3761189.1 MFS general substrate transporter [Cryphonectria parasitica EP155]